MPCGSNHSCLDCIHYTSATQPCTYISRMTEDEYDEFNKNLYEPEK